MTCSPFRCFIQLPLLVLLYHNLRYQPICLRARRNYLGRRFIARRNLPGRAGEARFSLRGYCLDLGRGHVHSVAQLALNCLILLALKERQPCQR